MACKHVGSNCHGLGKYGELTALVTVDQDIELAPVIWLFQDLTRSTIDEKWICHHHDKDRRWRDLPSHRLAIAR